MDKIYRDIEWIVSGWYTETMEAEDVIALSREIRDYISEIADL